MIHHSMRSPWFATAIHVGLWALLALTLLRLGGAALPYVETTAYTSPASSPVPVARLASLFHFEHGRERTARAAAPSAFATTYFVPPAPPAPTTRRLEIVYLGFFQTGNDPQKVFLQADGALKVCGMGDPIATDLFVAGAAMQTLMLTNAAAETNLFTLNAKKVVEVPIR